MQDQISSLEAAVKELHDKRFKPRGKRHGNAGRTAHNREDLIGQRFGRLIVLEYHSTREKRAYWWCQCDCGKTKIASGLDLKTGSTKSCGCLRNKDCELASGMRFGRLTVIGPAPKGEGKSSGRYWLCRCECGKEIIANTGSLIKGTCNRSCGCFHKAFLNKRPKGVAAEDWALARYKQSSAKRGVTFNLTREEAGAIFRSPCHYCGSMPTRQVGKRMNGDFWCNGIDRLENSRGYEPDNVVPCCKSCNYAKHKMGYQEFIGWVTKVYRHLVAPVKTRAIGVTSNGVLF